MRSEEYKQIYDKVSLTKEADERIQQALLKEVSGAEMKQKRKGIRFAQAIAVAAVLVLVVGIMQFPAVSSATQDVVGRLSKLIKVEPVEIESEPVEAIEYGYPTSSYVYSDSTEYLTVNPDAPKKECKMDSLEEVSEVLGIDLLQSENAHEQKNCIQYTPDVSNSGVLNGVVIQDSFYALGDIRDSEIKVYQDKDNIILYREGEKYRSPIRMQITIKTGSDGGEDVVINELSNGGGGNVTVHKLNDGGQPSNLAEEADGALSTLSQEVYEIENLGVDAVLSSVDGVPEANAWNKRGGEELHRYVEAYFVYAGVEYRYMGAVSTETMKEFLETLEIPDVVLP